MREPQRNPETQKNADTAVSGRVNPRMSSIPAANFALSTIFSLSRQLFIEKIATHMQRVQIYARCLKGEP